MKWERRNNRMKRNILGGQRMKDRGKKHEIGIKENWISKSRKTQRKRKRRAKGCWKERLPKRNLKNGWSEEERKREIKKIERKGRRNEGGANER